MVSTRQVRIAKRVCRLGCGGWEVLHECAHCVLRACRNGASAAAQVGRHALEAPAQASAALEAASAAGAAGGGGGGPGGERLEKAVRQLMEAMTVALRQGRCAAP